MNASGSSIIMSMPPIMPPMPPMSMSMERTTVAKRMEENRNFILYIEQLILRAVLMLREGQIGAFISEVFKSQV